MITKEYFVGLSIDSARIRLDLLPPKDRQAFYDAYLKERNIDLNNPPPITDDRTALHLNSASTANSPTKISKTSPDIEPSRALGRFLVVIGLAIVTWSFFFDVSVGGYGYGSSVANLDKMNIRAMILASGLTCAIAGVITVGFANVVAAVNLAKRN